MVALTLPRLHWGPKDSTLQALVVHGLGSSAATTWRLSEALAEAGWSATAVDLRGHGLAPRGSSYRIEDFAEDLAATTPVGGGSWDVVIGHSIGAASAVFAAHHNPSWAERLILLDPALELGDATREQVLENQRQGHLHQGGGGYSTSQPALASSGCGAEGSGTQAGKPVCSRARGIR
jgi:Lysophospholipase